MKRLTDIINGWTFEETIKTAESLMEAEKNMFKWDVLRHLRDFAENYREQIKEYQQLEEQGRLVKSPCKVGDTVYCINPDKNTINELVVYGFDIRPLQRFVYDYMGARLNFNQFGKAVFLTKSEAEEKLKELRGGENE